jgi:3D (Asp-Asp-Asp) domain-containing protein
MNKPITLIIILILILLIGIPIFYRLDNPRIEVREKVIVEKEYIPKYIIKEVDPYQWNDFIVTGYSANDPQQGTNNITATTFDLDYTRVQQLPIIATDPDVIPLYSIVEIQGMGAFISLDTGGAIRGNRIDILFDSKEEALKFGKQKLPIRVLD